MIAETVHVRHRLTRSKRPINTVAGTEGNVVAVIVTNSMKKLLRALFTILAGVGYVASIPVVRNWLKKQALGKSEEKIIDVEVKK